MTCSRGVFVLEHKVSHTKMSKHDPRKLSHFEVSMQVANKSKRPIPPAILAKSSKHSKE